MRAKVNKEEPAAYKRNPAHIFQQSTVQTKEPGHGIVEATKSKTQPMGRKKGNAQQTIKQDLQACLKKPLKEDRATVRS